MKSMERTRQALEKLQLRIAAGKLKQPEKIGAAAERLLQRSHGYRYYSWELHQGGFRYFENAAGLGSEKGIEGKYVIATSELGLSVLEVVAIYKDLSDVERGFRQLKDVLAMRPIYHQIEARVKAHIFVATLALLVQRLLDRRLEEAGINFSAERAMEALQTVRLVTFRMDDRPERRGVSGGCPDARGPEGIEVDGFEAAYTPRGGGNRDVVTIRKIESCPPRGYVDGPQTWASGFSVGGSALDRALTARTIKGRILGKSKMTPELPVNVVFYATDNNLGVRGDALRRIIPCRLETTEERPEERTGFKIQGDLLAYVKEHRGELVAAGLTILRAYIVAGRPDQGLTPMDYPAWCGLIRNAVKWVTAQDPCEARKELTMSDENTIERKALIDGWEALCSLANKQNLTAAEAREGVDQPALPSPAVVALRDIFMSWTRDGKLPSAKSIGRRIAKYRDRNCGGKCFKRTCSDPVAWYVQAV